MLCRFVALIAMFLVAMSMATDCSSTLTPTKTWKPSCTHISNSAANGAADCWAPAGVPSSDDVVMFPAGTNLTVSGPNATIGGSLTEIFHVKSAVVASGATVHMVWGAWVVTECFQVNGHLKYAEGNVPTYDISSVDGSHYLPDPTIPEETDCKKVNGGFVPRICGPGTMYIRSGGHLTMKSSGYSSLWLTTVVEKDAKFVAHYGSFIWSNVTNFGTLSTHGMVYLHGFIFNQADAYANFSIVMTDKWAETFVDSPPVMMENRGVMRFNKNLHTTNAYYPDGTSGTYKAAIVNYNELYFYPDPNDFGWGVEQVSTGNFDVFNFGITKFTVSAQSGDVGFWGEGNYLNHGTMIADGMNVYLSTLHNIGGRLVTTNTGTFNFGNGAVDPQSVKLCTMSQSQERQSRMAEEVHAPVVEKSGDGCWWYGSFCYPSPYLWRAPQLKPKLELRMGTANAIAVELKNVIAAAKLPTPCSKRYGFQDTVISGDGTGSVVSTVPVEVLGTLKIATGGKFYSLAEHRNPPTFGGGRLLIGKAGEAHIGIDADFNHDGSIVVGRGGLLSIPKHARVMFTNHTVDVQLGGTFNLDGLLTAAAHTKPISNCGRVRGNGKFVGRDEDFKCNP